MQQIVVHELFFVVEMSKVESYTELPRVAYVTLTDAVKALDNRSGWEVKSYYYVWNIVQRNLR